MQSTGAEYPVVALKSAIADGARGYVALFYSLNNAGEDDTLSR